MLCTRPTNRALLLTTHAGPISNLLKYLQSRQADTNAYPPRQQAARSGNVFGLDEEALAAEAARKISLVAAAAANAAAPAPSGYGASAGAGYGGAGGYGAPGMGGRGGYGGGPYGASAAAGGVGGYGPAPAGPPMRGGSPAGIQRSHSSGLGAPGAGGYGPAPAAGAAPGFGAGPAGGGGPAGPGQELVLRGAGLREVPGQVWQAAPTLTKLDLSQNQVGAYSHSLVLIVAF